MSVMAPAAESTALLDSAPGNVAGGEPAAEPIGPECTYEVVIKRLIIRDAPSTGGGIVHVLRQGERVTGTPCARGGVPWLRLSRETLRTHEHAEVFAGEGSAWAMIDATESGLGLGQLLVRVPAELGWCEASRSKRARSEVWEVVDKVGLVVSKETETSSAAEPERLSAGALVKALESVGERLRYQILTGTGPEKGWVSTRAGTRELLAKVSNMMPAGAMDIAGSAPESGDAAAADGGAAAEDPRRVREALLQYGKQFGKARDSDSLIFDRQSFSLWPGDEEAGPAGVAPQAAMRAELERDLGLAAPASDVARTDGKDAKPGGATPAASTGERDTEDDAWDASSEADPDSDSDLEAVLCCPKCTLPVGELAYASPGTGACVHGECIAQLMLKEMRAAEEERLKKEARKKQLRRKEYDIGWTADRIPSNVKPVARLTGGKLAIPEGGMCRLVLQESDRRVRVEATVDPAASVNLEYLSVALKVRRHEGREPLFSLDPVDPALPESMQVKRFEPHWLKGTSVGDVLFEADYHLKELSMGEYPQPITGMKSCLDLSEEEGRDKAWAARQWFVVRKANVQLSQDGTLIPVCKMGVEAREQSVNSKGELQDLKMTRQDHPMVKFAESFTQNFDLIAERKSVIFHLRELARASILAKYLIESNAELERPWFGLYSETTRPCWLEIPQLWNDRCYSQIHVLDGKIDYGAKGTGTHSVYGGVQFGLNRFNVAPSAAVSARSMSRSRPGMVPGRVPGRVYLAPTARMSAGMWAPPHMLGSQPRGVDLNLNKFDLAAHTKVTREAPVASGDVPDACVAMGQAFWPLVDGDASALGEEDRALLRDVFHPRLSDRRSEGRRFVPPDPGAAYVQRLRALVREEEKVRQQRKDHFYSARFAASEPGRLFPASWSEAFEVAHGKAPAKSLPPPGSLHPRPDYRAQEGLLDIVTASTAPAFERSTEDGTVFRIYRLGSLELRTSQEHGKPEDLGVVFATNAPADGTSSAPEQERDSKEREEVAKVTEYVESNPGGGEGASYRYYVVLETERGDTAVTEQLSSGAVTWELNPPNLNQRNSLAKVYRSVLHTDKAQGIRLRDLGGCRKSHASDAASQSARRRYAHAAYEWACGEDHAAPLLGPAAQSRPALNAVAAQRQQSELQQLLGLGDEAMAGSRVARVL